MFLVLHTAKKIFFGALQGSKKFDSQMKYAAFFIPSWGFRWF